MFLNLQYRLCSVRAFVSSQNHFGNPKTILQYLPDPLEMLLPSFIWAGSVQPCAVSTLERRSPAKPDPATTIPTPIFLWLFAAWASRRSEQKGDGISTGEEGGRFPCGGAVGRGQGIRVGGLRHRLRGARRVAAEGAVLGRGSRHQVLHHPSQGHLPCTTLSVLHPPVSSRRYHRALSSDSFVFLCVCLLAGEESRHLWVAGKLSLAHCPRLPNSSCC